MFLIGLAGGSGSGKSLVSGLFEAHRIPSFDCDAAYHELISKKCPLTSELGQIFGDGILFPDGSVNRRALAEIVFADEEKRKTLNHITHVHVLDALHGWLKALEKDGQTVAVVDAPLLFESGFDRECDVTLAVTAPTETRIKRIMERDGITKEQAAERIASQIPDDELEKRADFVIRNDGDVMNVDKQFQSILQKINERRNKK